MSPLRWGCLRVASCYALAPAGCIAAPLLRSVYAIERMLSCRQSAACLCVSSGCLRRYTDTLMCRSGTTDAPGSVMAGFPDESPALWLCPTVFARSVCYVDVWAVWHFFSVVSGI